MYCNVAQPSDLKSFSKLLVKIVFPCLTFSNFRVYSVELLAKWYVASVASLLTLALGASVGKLSAKLLRLPQPYSQILVLCTTFGNVGALPYVDSADRAQLATGERRPKCATQRVRHHLSLRHRLGIGALRPRPEIHREHAIRGGDRQARQRAGISVGPAERRLVWADAHAGTFRSSRSSGTRPAQERRASCVAHRVHARAGDSRLSAGHRRRHDRAATAAALAE